MNLHRWLREHSLRLLAIRDTPGAIAGGVAIGIFFGFTPFIGLKTLSAIFFAWLSRSNIIAAVLACTLHNILVLFMPAIYLWEYKVGYWLISQPHQWPLALRSLDWTPHVWWSWRTFLTIGRPLLVGSLVCAAPIALATFFLTNFVVGRHQIKKTAQPPSN